MKCNCPECKRKRILIGNEDKERFHNLFLSVLKERNYRLEKKRRIEEDV